MVARKGSERSARLGWVFEGVWDVESEGPNRSAANATLAALGSLGRFEDVDVALVMGFQMLAAAVDADPTNAALWREYRAAEVALRLVGGDGDADPFAKLAAEFASLGDAEDAEP